VLDGRFIEWGDGSRKPLSDVAKVVLGPKSCAIRFAGGLKLTVLRADPERS